MASKKLQYAIGNSASTTLSVAASNADTTLTITSDTNFAAKSGEGMVIIDEGEDTEELAYASSKSGSALSVTLANRGLEGGSAQSHAINSTIKGVLTAGMWNDMIDSVANILDATAGTVKSFNMPTAGSVNDANGNELIKFPATVSSATNEITISNAANSSSPTISATGSSDSNINIALTPKGTGVVDITAGGLTVGAAARFEAAARFDTQAYFDAEVDNGNSSTADTVDWTAGNKQKSTLTGNCTFTFTAPTGPCNLILKLVQDGTGSRTVTWPATVMWTSATAPTLTTTAAGIDIVSFYWDGTNYFGQAGLAFGVPA